MGLRQKSGRKITDQTPKSMVQAGSFMGESLPSLERGKKVDQLAGKIFTFFFLF